MMDGTCCGPGYASPEEAIKAPREKLLNMIAIYTGTGIQKPGSPATVDADPDSPTYSQVIHRHEMPGIGDELHHMGWNACSSCHDDAGMSRKYLLVPGGYLHLNKEFGIVRRWENAMGEIPFSYDFWYVLLCVARATTDCTLEIGVESHAKLYRNPFLDPLEPHELRADIATPKEV